MHQRLRSRTPPAYLVLAACLTILASVILFSLGRIRYHWDSQIWDVDTTRPQGIVVPSTPRDMAANNTLGVSPTIHKVENSLYMIMMALQYALIVSKAFRGGQRSQLALARTPSAAKITNLAIDIPIQSSFTDELVSAFMDLGPQASKHPNRGSALAWLAHLDMIKYFIASDLDTAMIMEDDVDWDTAIKKQMPLISDAVRNFSRVDPSDPAPYGRSWDVLWLGHCGEITENDTHRLEFNDTTPARPAPWEFYAGWSKFKINNVKEGHQVIQMAILPVYSFGYALNRENAQKVLAWAGRGADEAFDVVLSVGYREGHLNCIIINPEVMHHYLPSDAHGYVSEVQAGDGKGDESKEEDFESVKGQTANMVRSARCEALFHDTCVQPP